MKRVSFKYVILGFFSLIVPRSVEKSIDDHMALGRDKKVGLGTVAEGKRKGRDSPA